MNTIHKHEHEHGRDCDHGHEDDHAHAKNDHEHAKHDHGHGHAAAAHTCHDHGAHGGHSHAPEVGRHNEKVVLIGFVLTFAFMIVEIVGGIVSGSLALVADAGHMLIDAVALGLAWAGFRFGRRVSDGLRTFGYMRFEVLAGLINAVTLIALITWITYEAVQRLFNPQPILTGPMLIVAVLGLVINIAVFLTLVRGDRDHVNIKGAMLHVLGDLLGSVAAIVAAVAIYFTGWTPMDPILSVLLSALILRSAWHLLKGSLHILMEGTPPNVVVDELRAHIVNTVPGIVRVGHVHVWSITSGKSAATLEIQVATVVDPWTCCRLTKQELSRKYGIAHATVEVAAAGSPDRCALVVDKYAAPHAH